MAYNDIDADWPPPNPGTASSGAGDPTWPPPEPKVPGLITPAFKTGSTERTGQVAGPRESVHA